LDSEGAHYLLVFEHVLAPKPGPLSGDTLQNYWISDDCRRASLIGHPSWTSVQDETLSFISQRAM
jgi:hypothetical protein